VRQLPAAHRPSVRARAFALLALPVLALFVAACGALPFIDHPAANYEYSSGRPLRVAVVDEAGGPWTPPLLQAMQRYSEATTHLRFQRTVAGAHIIITVKRYTDGNAPTLEGYDFPQGAGGFATVYDSHGAACNYPPSTLPLNCSGEIATAQIWLNDAIPPGSDIEERRIRLILHELGHAMGLTRHSPDLDIGQLAARYGWPD
jgi:hypothetical protein